jgi:hypothetical protein
MYVVLVTILSTLLISLAIGSPLPPKQKAASTPRRKSRKEGGIDKEGGESDVAPCQFGAPLIVGQCF